MMQNLSNLLTQRYKNVQQPEKARGQAVLHNGHNEQLHWLNYPLSHNMYMHLYKGSGPMFNEPAAFEAFTCLPVLPQSRITRSPSACSLVYLLQNVLSHLVLSIALYYLHLTACPWFHIVHTIYITQGKGMAATKLGFTSTAPTAQLETSLCP